MTCEFRFEEDDNTNQKPILEKEYPRQGKSLLRKIKTHLLNYLILLALLIIEGTEMSTVCFLPSRSLQSSIGKKSKMGNFNKS